MSEKYSEFPYRSLGIRLKKARQKLQETLAEVSGAVEIDLDTLKDIEYGALRPSEDVLLLLANHFDLSDEATTKLWELAGYDKAEVGSTDSDTPNTVFVMPFDVRVVYADMAHVTANEFGVVVNFLQSGGANSQPMAISRVGMSREHAKSVIRLMQEALDQSAQPKTPRALEAPKSNKRTSTKGHEG